MPQDPSPLSDAQWLERLQGAPKVSSSSHLGFEFIEVNQEENSVTAHCYGRDEFLNPLGFVQGGYVSAMLDEVTAIASYVMSGGKTFPATLEHKTSFFRPTPAGQLKAVGKVIRLGNSGIFIEGFLYDQKDRLLAKLSTTATPVSATSA